MRYTIFNGAGKLAVAGHRRPTLEAALDWANDLVANGANESNVSIIDNDTGQKYDGAGIAELNRLREDGHA